MRMSGLFLFVTPFIKGFANVCCFLLTHIFRIKHYFSINNAYFCTCLIKKRSKQLYGKRFINPRLYLRSQLGSMQ